MRDRGEARRVLPPNWYLAGGPVAPGQHRTPPLGPLECVLFRGQSGQLSALSAHCGHLGAHLGGGKVVGDCLECPLHGWRYGPEGKCRLARQVVYPARQHLGASFVASQDVPFPEPLLGTTPAASLLGQPWRLDCPWQAVVLNAFDAQHLARVHRRRLVESRVAREGGRLVWRYRSQVTGGSLARFLSGDRIEVTVTCHKGTLLAVESHFGRHWGGLLISLVPLGAAACQARPLFLARHAWQLRVARFFFEAFLRADLKVLQGMQPPHDPPLLLPEDEVVRELVAYLREEGLWFV